MASDDNSDGWLAESDQVMATLVAQLSAKHALDGTAFPTSAMNERHEGECLLGNDNSVLPPPSSC